MNPVHEHCSSQNFSKKKIKIKVKSNELKFSKKNRIKFSKNKIFVDQNDLFKMKLCLALLMNARTGYMNYLCV